MVLLKVDGMSCGHCVKHVEAALQGVPGAGTVQVDLTRGEARVEGSADAVALVAAVVEEGYRAEVVG